MSPPPTRARLPHAGYLDFSSSCLRHDWLVSRSRGPARWRREPQARVTAQRERASILKFVIPAKAGILLSMVNMESRVHGNDERISKHDCRMTRSELFVQTKKKRAK
ncbi:hypothetical protein BH11GEM2_BH11GEM2_40910 [soil metagenome]